MTSVSERIAPPSRQGCAIECSEGGSVLPVHSVSLAFLLLATLAGCAPKHPDASLCSHAYLPTSEGVGWTYSDAHGSGVREEWTRVVTRVEPGRAVDLTRTWSDVSRRSDVQRWECRPEGLAWLLTGAKEDLEFHSVTLDGVTLPVGLAPGMTWTSVLNVEYTIRALTYHEVSTSTSMSGPIETLTVPAGTFQALPITTQSLNERTLLPGTVPQLIHEVSRAWYVEGVGMVRRSYGPAGQGPAPQQVGPGDSFEEKTVTELVRFQGPPSTTP